MMETTAHRTASFAHTDLSVQATKGKMKKMKIKLSNKLYIMDAPKWLHKWCYNNLVLPNPDFYKKERLGKWTGNTPREIYLYEKVGDTLVLPFGIWNRHFYEMVKPETESIESDIKPFKAIEYKSGTTLYPYQEKAEAKRHNRDALWRR